MQSKSELKRKTIQMAPKTIVENMYTVEDRLERIVAHTLNDYQKFTPTTAIYPKDVELVYLTLGLMGELQEWFDSGYDLKEAGDIFWYCSQLCNYYDLELYITYSHAESIKDYYCKVNIAEQLKKHLRDGKDIRDTVYQYMIYALSQLRHRYHYSMNNPSLSETIINIIKLNTEKLSDRKDRNVLQGDGDTR
jgi:NTP pyrophosphatase (non-canonical NTP hydrolase)